MPGPEVIIILGVLAVAATVLIAWELYDRNQESERHFEEFVSASGARSSSARSPRNRRPRAYESSDEEDLLDPDVFPRGERSRWESASYGPAGEQLRHRAGFRNKADPVPASELSSSGGKSPPRTTRSEWHHMGSLRGGDFGESRSQVVDVQLEDVFQSSYSPPPFPADEPPDNIPAPTTSNFQPTQASIPVAPIHNTPLAHSRHLSDSTFSNVSGGSDWTSGFASEVNIDPHGAATYPSDLRPETFSDDDADFIPVLLPKEEVHTQDSTENPQKDVISRAVDSDSDWSQLE
ncbi:hypothetical protein M427DRAFT_58940 [Gonapodya prolifera JEL478]|uniref:Uncharacterized protein n=1 Tax=Gonapodya prolifera (strain JEL478) TaxID=1344416 RepID=A0A139A989_GONPJ|nr:hypothetical protein M427DRAFT_58940 [Gonapodya prolifera JEL478]|eukprot:KXS13228.1 hypothetical protein M427DRAFT_58940 [Gonapodya prolifera JEL478]